MPCRIEKVCICTNGVFCGSYWINVHICVYEMNNEYVSIILFRLFAYMNVECLTQHSNGIEPVNKKERRKGVVWICRGGLNLVQRKHNFSESSNNDLNDFKSLNSVIWKHGQPQRQKLCLICRNIKRRKENERKREQNENKSSVKFLWNRTVVLCFSLCHSPVSLRYYSLLLGLLLICRNKCNFYRCE